MNQDVSSSLARVRARVATKTNIQDIAEPLTGRLDQRRIATRINNIEHAVGDLADAVDTLNAKVDRGAVEDVR